MSCDCQDAAISSETFISPCLHVCVHLCYNFSRWTCTVDALITNHSERWEPSCHLCAKSFVCFVCAYCCKMDHCHLLFVFFFPLLSLLLRGLFVSFSRGNSDQRHKTWDTSERSHLDQQRIMTWFVVECDLSADRRSLSSDNLKKAEPLNRLRLILEFWNTPSKRFEVCRFNPSSSYSLKLTKRHTTQYKVPFL